MPKNDSDQGHAVALFRYGLIADLVQLQPGSKGLYALIAQKAASEYSIPGSTRTRVAEETASATGSRRTGAAVSTPCCPSHAPTAGSRAHCPRRWSTPCWMSRREIQRFRCN